MIPYSQVPLTFIDSIADFIPDNQNNLDRKTVNSFGKEWTKFSSFTTKELNRVGEQYFDIVNENIINKDTIILDIGCGTGRWAKYISPRVKFIECIDPAEDAVRAAQKFTKDCGNIRITKAGIDNIPFADESFDFIICLGVLHHVPDSGDALIKAVSKLKKNGFILLYLYYNFENRGVFFKTIFAFSDFLRTIISKFPFRLKALLAELLVWVTYIPFILTARIVKAFSSNSDIYKYIPLSYYTDKSLHVIRNDALDRFGTPIEKRYSRIDIELLMKRANLKDVTFSSHEPYWHATAKKVR